MSFCDSCGNFVDIKEHSGVPRIVCNSCKKESAQNETIIITQYKGGRRHTFDEIDEEESDRIIINLSYENSLAKSKDVKCKKCNIPASYIIGNSNQYKYVCSSCHKKIDV
jgi:DNA-directed RNA polymerase subunit M/transcription elongation factor TFIIS